NRVNIALAVIKRGGRAQNITGYLEQMVIGISNSRHQSEDENSFIINRRQSANGCSRGLFLPDAVIGDLNCRVNHGSNMTDKGVRIINITKRRRISFHGRTSYLEHKVALIGIRGPARKAPATNASRKRKEVYIDLNFLAWCEAFWYLAEKEKVLSRKPHSHQHQFACTCVGDFDRSNRTSVHLNGIECELFS